MASIAHQFFPTKFHCFHTKLDFDDVLIVPKQTSILSRGIVNINRRFTFKNGVQWTGVPIVSSNMDTVTSLKTADILRTHSFLSCFPKHHNEAWADKTPAELVHTNSYMLSSGVSKKDYYDITHLIKKLANDGINVKFVCFDVANGYMTLLNDVCKQFKDEHPDIVLVAGNVVTPKGCRDLIKSGVDVVKIGIGSGAGCTTRLKTGIGYPQLSAVLECMDSCYNSGVYMMSDGGCVYPCDIVKAFAAGADFCMLGSMLAGHEESPGDQYFNPKTNQMEKEFRGMSSESANNKYNGGLKGYRTSEGRSVCMPVKGPLEKTLLDIEGGLRSACSYVGCNQLMDLYDNTEFVWVTKHHNTSLVR